MDELVLDEDKFKSIARLPSRNVLDGQLAGVVASPLTGLVRGLGSMISGLALQLGQIAEKGLVTGEAPAEEPSRPAARPASPRRTARRSQAAGEEPCRRRQPTDEARAEEPADEAATSRRPTRLPRTRRTCRGRGGARRTRMTDFRDFRD